MSRGLIRRAVSRTERDSMFVGCAISWWREKEGLTADEALKALGATSEGYERLVLCLMPEQGPSSFPASVDRIASYAGCDPDRLLSILRDFGVARVFAERYSASSTMLMAARDKEKADPEE